MFWWHDKMRGLFGVIELRRLFLGLADTQRPWLAPGSSLNGSRRYCFVPALGQSRVRLPMIIIGVG